MAHIYVNKDKKPVTDDIEKFLEHVDDVIDVVRKVVYYYSKRLAGLPR